MEFKLQTLNNVLKVTKIANVHFFEFDQAKQTESGKHPFCELLFSYAGTIAVDGENFKGKLKKGEMIIISFRLFGNCYYFSIFVFPPI